MTAPVGQATPRISLAERLRLWVERRLARAVARLATSVYGLNGSWRSWRPALMRSSAHLAIVTVALVAIALSNIRWPARAAATLSLPALSASAESSPSLSVSVRDADSPDLLRATGLRNEASTITAVVMRMPQPNTIIPERPRLGIITYTVQAGDTVQTIAAAFGLQPATIMWSNPEVEDAPDLLRIGQELVILPIDGVYHTVAEGETLATIAEKYKATPEAIAQCKYNGLQPPLFRIEPGMRLIVPGGEKPYVPKSVTTYEGPVPEGVHGSGQLMWPVLGTITQGYWYGHRAIDIGAPTGSAVLAADSGFVSFAGWTDVGYGYLVVIDHTNGFVTYYAHLSAIYVYEGQGVERGQVIGAVGSTGWSTGPHLHFEVRYNGVQQNPRAYLP